MQLRFVLFLQSPPKPPSLQWSCHFLKTPAQSPLPPKLILTMLACASHSRFSFANPASTNTAAGTNQRLDKTAMIPSACIIIPTPVTYSMERTKLSTRQIKHALPDWLFKAMVDEDGSNDRRTHNKTRRSRHNRQVFSGSTIYCISTTRTIQRMIYFLLHSRLIVSSIILVFFIDASFLASGWHGKIYSRWLPVTALPAPPCGRECISSIRCCKNINTYGVFIVRCQ